MNITLGRLQNISFLSAYVKLTNSRGEILAQSQLVWSLETYGYWLITQCLPRKLWRKCLIITLPTCVKFLSRLIQSFEWSVKTARMIRERWKNVAVKVLVHRHSKNNDENLNYYSLCTWQVLQTVYLCYQP